MEVDGTIMNTENEEYNVSDTEENGNEEIQPNATKTRDLALLERIVDVAEMILAGNYGTELLRDITQKYKIGIRHARNYRKKAIEFILANEKELSTEEEAAVLIGNLKYIVKETMAKKKYTASIAALRTIADVKGLKPASVEQAPSPIQINIRYPGEKLDSAEPKAIETKSAASLEQLRRDFNL